MVRHLGITVPDTVWDAAVQFVHETAAVCLSGLTYKVDRLMESSVAGATADYFNQSLALRILDGEVLAGRLVSEGSSKLGNDALFSSNLYRAKYSAGGFDGPVLAEPNSPTFTGIPTAPPPTDQDVGYDHSWFLRVDVGGVAGCDNGFLIREVLGPALAAAGHSYTYQSREGCDRIRIDHVRLQAERTVTVPVGHWTDAQIDAFKQSWVQVGAPAEPLLMVRASDLKDLAEKLDLLRDMANAIDDMLDHREAIAAEIGAELRPHRAAVLAAKARAIVNGERK